MNDIKVFTNDEYPLLKNIHIPCGEESAYILECDDSVKIGYSQNPYGRLTRLKQILKNLGFTTGRMAILPSCVRCAIVEANLHSIFRDYRVGKSEIFSINFDDALEEIKKHELKDLKKIRVRRETVEEPEENSEETDLTKILLQIEQRLEKVEALLKASLKQ